MKITQLSIFLENKPGQLAGPCKALADANINILTLALADTQRYGILRLIVAEPERAKAVLEAAGCVVRETAVLAVEVPDKPGGLAQILTAIEDEPINVEYMYAFSCGKTDRALLVFRFDDPDKASEALRAKQISVVGKLELFGSD